MAFIRERKRNYGTPYESWLGGKDSLGSPASGDHC